jgi:hypothetical protein
MISGVYEYMRPDEQFQHTVDEVQRYKAYEAHKQEAAGPKYLRRKSESELTIMDLGSDAGGSGRAQESVNSPYKGITFLLH